MLLHQQAQHDQELPTSPASRAAHSGRDKTNNSFLHFGTANDPRSQEELAAAYVRSVEEARREAEEENRVRVLSPEEFVEKVNQGEIGNTINIRELADPVEALLLLKDKGRVAFGLGKNDVAKVLYEKAVLLADVIKHQSLSWNLGNVEQQQEKALLSGKQPDPDEFYTNNQNPYHDLQLGGKHSRDLERGLRPVLLERYRDCVPLHWELEVVAFAPLYANLAAVHVEQQEYILSFQNASKALLRHPRYDRARLRKVQSLVGLANWLDWELKTVYDRGGYEIENSNNHSVTVRDLSWCCRQLAIKYAHQYNGAEGDEKKTTLIPEAAQALQKDVYSLKGLKEGRGLLGMEAQRVSMTEETKASRQSYQRNLLPLLEFPDDFAHVPPAFRSAKKVGEKNAKIWYADSFPYVEKRQKTMTVKKNKCGELHTHSSWKKKKDTSADHHATTPAGDEDHTSGMFRYYGEAGWEWSHLARLVWSMLQTYGDVGVLVPEKKQGNKMKTSTEGNENDVDAGVHLVGSPGGRGGPTSSPGRPSSPGLSPPGSSSTSSGPGSSSTTYALLDMDLRGGTMPTKRCKNLVIVLHGHGDSMNPFLNLPTNLHLQQTAFLFLNGPDDESSFFKERAGKPCRSWFPNFETGAAAMGEYVDSMEEIEEENLDNCVRVVKHKLFPLLESLVHDCGWGYNEIFLLGHGQGGEVALELFYQLYRKSLKASAEENAKHGFFQLGGILASSCSLLPARRLELRAHLTEKNKRAALDSKQQMAARPSPSPPGASSSATANDIRNKSTPMKLLQEVTVADAEMKPKPTPIFLVHGKLDKQISQNVFAKSCALLGKMPDRCELRMRLFANRGGTFLNTKDPEECTFVNQFFADALHGWGRRAQEETMKRVVQRDQSVVAMGGQ
ncbi:unnamed protein product [Amoebophrya sp. A120]|nr:unnamed protein product [Amoebophrya sp. A120]|eukprot:GSA120T00001610001.1